VLHEDCSCRLTHDLDNVIVVLKVDCLILNYTRQLCFVYLTALTQLFRFIFLRTINYSVMSSEMVTYIGQSI
jgi:hypothetical protein